MVPYDERVLADMIVKDLEMGRTIQRYLVGSL